MLTAAYVNEAATTSPAAATATGGASTASYVTVFPGHACRRDAITPAAVVADAPPPLRQGGFS